MKFFRQMTGGKVVVMGRKTLESFPNGLPLKNRTNIVLTGNPNYHVKDAVIVHITEELLEELKKYDCVILSDIGANTLLLPAATFTKSVKMPNRANLIRDYVQEGGALLMIGGYLTFSGVDAKGKWHDTAVQEVLPVEVLTVDDRMEHCEGIRPVTVKEHEALKGLPKEWPEILGYNKTILKPEAEMAAMAGKDPFIAFGKYGKGRSAVFTSDCAPHWAPPEFCEWEYYDTLWQGILDWLTN